MFQALGNPHNFRHLFRLARLVPLSVFVDVARRFFGDLGLDTIKRFYFDIGQGRESEFPTGTGERIKAPPSTEVQDKPPPEDTP